jgi:uncharacterized membrane protein YhiD involved in acid resistance
MTGNVQNMVSAQGMNPTDTWLIVIGIMSVLVAIVAVIVTWFTVQSNKKMVKYMANTDNRENENHIVGDVSRIRAVENKINECTMARTKETNEKFADMNEKIAVMKAQNEERQKAVDLSNKNMYTYIDDKLESLETNINLRFDGILEAIKEIKRNGNK